MAKRANGEGTICKRKDGLWMTAVMLGRDAATGKPIRKYCYGKTKKEVQQKKEALLEKSKGPVYVDADKITVGQWVEKWLNVYAKASVRANTFIGYRSVVFNHILPHLGGIKLQKLKGLIFRAWLTKSRITAAGRAWPNWPFPSCALPSTKP